MTMTDWYLFEGDTGSLFGRTASLMGAERKIGTAWNVSRHNLTIEMISEGGRVVTHPLIDTDDAPDDVPTAFFVLPADHPSIIVYTALTPPPADRPDEPSVGWDFTPEAKRAAWQTQHRIRAFMDCRECGPDHTHRPGCVLEEAP